MGENNMSINLINYALAKKDWKKAYEDLKVLEIGGRNLLRNGDFSSGLSYWEQREPNTITLDENGYSGYGLRIVSVNTGTVVPRQLYYGSFSAGEKLTVSVKVKTHSGDFSKMSARFADSFSIPFNYKKQLNDDWELYVFTGTVPSDYKFSGTVFGFYNTLGEFTIDEVKLEKGNKATDWTPAPEDIDAHPFVAELAETVYRSKQNEERIRNLENAITALGGGS